MASSFLDLSLAMAASGGENGDASKMFAKILALQECTANIIQKVQKKADDRKLAAEDARKEFERFSQRFREFANQSCPLGVQNLDPWILPTFLPRIQDLAQELKEISVRCKNLLGLANVHEIETAEEQNQLTDFLESKKLQASSSVVGQLMAGNLAAAAMGTGGEKIQKELQEMNGQVCFDFLKLKLLEAPDGKHSVPPRNAAPMLSPAVIGRIEARKEIEAFNLRPKGIEWSLTDIIMELYGFDHEEALKIGTGVANALAGWTQFQGGTEETARLTRTKILNWETGKLTAAKILDWDSVKEMKQHLQRLKADENQKFGDAVPVLLFKVWVFGLENQIYNLVRHLRSMMSGNEAAMARLRQLRRSLIQLCEDNHGMVPIVVHRTVALLGSQGLVEQSDLNRDQEEALRRNLDFDGVIASIYKMILQLGKVLFESGKPNATVSSPQALEAIEKALGKVEEEMGRIEERIIEGWEKAQRKRKREDEPGWISMMP